ncbi:MAG: hypothetical protein QOE84_2992, partial [Actinomycetota bacterium]|nr:hypothetical protein [Actinomycetota bacterium]
MSSLFSVPALTRGRDGLRGRLVSAVPAAVLVVLVLAVASRQPSFVGAASMRALLEGAAPLLLLALGQMFVILIGGI